MSTSLWTSTLCGLLATAACGSSDALAPSPNGDAGHHVPPDAHISPSPHCPSGLKGATLVHVDFPGLGSFCIDSTEITNTHYQVFLDSAPVTDPSDPLCAWNASFLPARTWPPAPYTEEHPVGSLDWCDAASYCKWAGKRLCRSTGASPTPPSSSFGGDLTSEWYLACSAGGTRAFPYGSTFDSSACTTPTGDVHAVRSLKKCEGGIPGLFDMSGNRWEWEDRCAGTAGVGDFCKYRGGSFTNEEENLSCAHEGVGFREDGILGSPTARCCTDAI